MANRCRAVLGFTVMLGVAGRAGAESRTPIAAAVYNQAGIAAETLARAKSEIERIFGEAGVDVTWMNPAAVEPAGRFTMRLLIRPRAVDAPESVMGTTAGDTHEKGGLASVFYDRVLRSAHGQHDVARVLAYAMAHEMGHLLLPFPAHSASGIMRAGWDDDDLYHIVTSTLRFTAAQMAALRVKASTCCGPVLRVSDADSNRIK